MNKEEIDNSMKAVFSKCGIATNIPTENDWGVLEARFNCQFSTSFKEFYQLSKNYDIPGLLNIQECSGGIESDDIAFVYDYESSEGGNWPSELLPFFELGNGDYLSLNRSKCPNSPVYLYSHADFSVREKYKSFEEWLHHLSDWFDD